MYPPTCLAAQTYTIREFTKTPEEIAASLKRLADIGYRAFQASALGPIAAPELRRLADENGLTICATHVAWNRLVEAFDEVVEEHHALGCHYLTVPIIPKELRNAEGYHRFAREATEVGLRLREHNLQLAYHNHSFEFERYEGRTGLQILFDESDPFALMAELDTYWVQHGGGDPSAWIQQLAGRVPLLHVKDMAYVETAPTFCEVGEGNLNWPRILDAGQAARVKWYIVEQDTCRRDPFESLAISLRHLQDMGLG